MTTIRHVDEVMAKNQKAVVVFTHGDDFYHDSFGNGTTGKWVASPDTLEVVDKVIIYLRRRDETVSRIYFGNYAGVLPSDLPRRYLIRFSALTYVGTTISNWREFCGGAQNPVCYVRR